MIIDHNPTFAQGLASVLGEVSGLDVAGVATSSQRGMDATVELEPDVITLPTGFLDIGPLELHRELRSLAPGSRFLIFVDVATGALVSEYQRAGRTVPVQREAPIREIVGALRHLSAKGASNPWLGTNWTRFTEGDGLKERESEVLRLVAQGFTSKEIAGLLCLAPNTVRSYCQEILSKLGARNRVHALAIAKARGLLT